MKEITKIPVNFLLVAGDDITGENCYKFVVIWRTEFRNEEKHLSRK